MAPHAGYDGRPCAQPDCYLPSRESLADQANKVRHLHGLVGEHSRLHSSILTTKNAEHQQNELSCWIVLGNAVERRISVVTAEQYPLSTQHSQMLRLTRCLFASKEVE